MGREAGDACPRLGFHNYLCVLHFWGEEAEGETPQSQSLCLFCMYEFYVHHAAFVFALQCGLVGLRNEEWEALRVYRSGVRLVMLAMCIGPR